MALMEDRNLGNGLGFFYYAWNVFAIVFLWQLQNNMCNIDIHYLYSGNLQLNY